MMDLMTLIWAIIKFALVLGLMMGNALVLVWVERKISGRIQCRPGPTRVGPEGGFQTVADTVKLMFKEDVVPTRADRPSFALAPAVMFVSALLIYVVIPFGPGVIVRDLNVGVMYTLAMAEIAVISILAAGWGSNNKYALLGAMRSAAQMLSFAVPLSFVVASVAMLAGTMSLQGIVRAQSHVWYVFLQPVAFLIYFICSLAEMNRLPFDLSAAEAELVAGFVTEYSGLRWSMFFLAEYSNLFAGAAMAATLFLGGWTGPFLPPLVWFLLKTYFFVFVIVWLRWTLPRVRTDQLMNLSWRVMVPLALANLLATGTWVVMR